MWSVWLVFCDCGFHFVCSQTDKRASLVTQKVKRLPAMWETWVPSLGWEDPLEKEMATHSSILAWKIPWTEEPGRLQSMGSQTVRQLWRTSLFLTDKDRRLWNLPDGRNWLWGKLGLVLLGGAMLSKSLIQFSLDGWGCVPSLLFDLRPKYDGGNEGNSNGLNTNF